MHSTETWHFGRRGALLSVAVASLALFSPQAFAQRFITKDVFVDSGAAVEASEYSGDVHVVTMPEFRQLSSMQAAMPQTHNLGTFNIVINPSPALAANTPALQAFERAAKMWERRIADPITVVVNADVAPLGPGILGSAGSQLLSANYATFRNAMVFDAADELDDAIVGSLPMAANYTVTLPAGFGLNGNAFASKANLKALGFDPGVLDAVAGTATDVAITFSSNFSFDYDKSNGITPGQFDFEGIAAHEIGHGLGFFSGVDEVDFFLPGTSNQIEPTPLDMFRFRDNVAADPATAADFANGTLGFPRNMVPQHIAMFDQISDEFGGDSEMLMSRGIDFGDGRQASHFKDNLGLGLLDPTAAPGELLKLTHNDLRALDLIGYEIQVPEPTSATLLAVAIGIALMSRRRLT
jgi:hypothetical protein